MRYNIIMKTIFLLRHAKSDWTDDDLADIDRPLAKRGLRDASRMGKFLAANARKWMPDTIITSPAVRAHETGKIISHSLKFGGQLRVDDQLYPGDVGSFFATLRSLPAHTSRVILVGHNPAIEQTAAALLQGDMVNFGTIKMPTGAIICFDVNLADWARLTPGSATLRWFLIPKLIKNLPL